MPYRSLLSILALAFAAAGCSGPSKSVADYEKAEPLKPLEVPPDLDSPRSDGALEIPEWRDSGSGEDGSRGGALLPKPENISVRSSGA